MWTLLKDVLRSVSGLIYPPICLHCHACLKKDQPIFCSECLQLLTLIDPIERCPYCFSADFNPLVARCCHQCQERPPLTERMAAAFDYEGPPATLITHMKYGGQAYLGEGAGAYLAAQFLQLGWPMPDVIVPMPISPLRKMERGYNQSQLLAASLGRLLGRPVKDVLRRRLGDYSQAGLNYQQRLQLSSQRFYLEKDGQLHDQTVLLIDDVMTTGSSLRCCAEVLQAAYPKSIYGLTLCRAI